MNDYLKIYENGTHGEDNWKYYGNTLVYVSWWNQSGDHWAEVKACFTDLNYEIYDELSDEIFAVNNYAATHEGWDAGDQYIYMYNWLMNKVETGIWKEYETYKFCFAENSSTPKDAFYRYWEEGANIEHSDSGLSDGNLTGTLITLVWNYVAGYPQLLLAKDQNQGPSVYTTCERNDYLIFNSGSGMAISDYLTGDQEPQIDPPGEPSDYDDTPITGSDAYNNIIANFLTNFTVLAEIDGTNLNIIAQSLNNNITLEDSVPEMLAKIGRALIQKNIADGIMSIKIVPIPKSGSLPYKSGIAEVLFNPIGLPAVQGKKLNNTIKKYTVGSMSIHRIYGDYRDFLCEYSIYLPFSGIHEIDADVVVDNILNIYADIDFLTGTILYHLVVNDGVTTRDIYQFTGECAIELPITGADYSAKYQSIMSGVFSGVGMIAGAAAGGVVGAGAGAALTGAVSSGLKTLGNAATVKGSYMQSGKLVPNSSALSVLYPYLIISKPQDVSPDYKSVKGRPTHKMLGLNSLSGFSIISNINLDSIAYATDEDKEALRGLLANGVYF